MVTPVLSDNTVMLVLPDMFMLVLSDNTVIPILPDHSGYEKLLLDSISISLWSMKVANHFQFN